MTADTTQSQTAQTAQTAQTLIPEKFRPMLAATIKGDADLQGLQYPLYCSPKIDGIRTLIHPTEGPVSRTLKKIPNKFIQYQLTPRDEYCPLNYLDGELVCYSTLLDYHNFQHTTSEVMTHHPEDRNTDFVYLVFDTWNPKYQHKTFHWRYSYIQEAVKTFASHYVRIVPHLLGINVQEVSAYERFWLSEGYEGAMLRNPDIAYKLGRSTLKEQGLMKLKRFEDAEAIIVGYEQFMHNANVAEEDAFGLTKRSSHQDNKVPLEALGALEVESVENSPFPGVRFYLGTGYTQEQRTQFWHQRDQLIGKTIKYKFQNTGVKDKPRFPVFLGFRHD